jgi:hypothetical protein
MPRTKRAANPQAVPENEIQKQDKRRAKAKPIGKTATGNSTFMPGSKDKVDEQGEETFPASDPPAHAAHAPAPAGQDISPARYLSPEELAKRKPR